MKAFDNFEGFVSNPLILSLCATRFRIESEDRPVIQANSRFESLLFLLMI